MMGVAGVGSSAVASATGVAPAVLRLGLDFFWVAARFVQNDVIKQKRTRKREQKICRGAFLPCLSHSSSPSS